MPRMSLSRIASTTPTARRRRPVGLVPVLALAAAGGGLAIAATGCSATSDTENTFVPETTSNVATSTVATTGVGGASATSSGAGGDLITTVGAGGDGGDRLEGLQELLAIAGNFHGGFYLLVTGGSQNANRRSRHDVRIEFR